MHVNIENGSSDPKEVCQTKIETIIDIFTPKIVLAIIKTFGSQGPMILPFCVKHWFFFLFSH